MNFWRKIDVAVLQSIQINLLCAQISMIPEDLALLIKMERWQW